MNQIVSKDVPFSNGRYIRLLEVLPSANAKDIREALELDVALKAVILIVGGATAANDDLQARLVQLFSRGLAQPSTKDTTLIIDRSTDGDIKKALDETLLDRTS